MFVLGSHKLSYRGFASFCHIKDDKDELIRHMANSSKNDKEILLLYRGGGEFDNVKLSDWTKESTSYFDRFFAKTLNDNDIICIPQHGPREDVVMRALKEWCLMGKALVVQNVDLSKHLELLKHPKYSFMSSKDKINQSSCYLVYNFNENIILYLCRGKGDNTYGNLEEQMSHCMSDVHLLVNLYQNELKLSGVKIIGLVISNSQAQNFKLKCEFCKVFVIPFKAFESPFTFQSWLEKFTKWFGISESNLSQQDSKSFSLFCTKMVSLIACTKCEYLPNFTANVTSQMEQACLLLNPEQMEILYSPCNFVILKGNFGTGKTIILQKKLEDLAQKLTEKQMIYYINYDGKSNSLINFKRSIEYICQKKSNKIKIRENNDGLKISGIFQSIANEVGQDIKSVHVFIDEYNSEDLTRNEVDLLKKNLREEHFKDSVIFIASQAIEKVRIDTFQYTSETLKSEGHLFHELEDIFQIEELTYAMRTTVQVNTVMELLQEFLQNKKNEFIHFESLVSVNRTGVRSLNVRKTSPAGNFADGESTKTLFVSVENKNDGQTQSNNTMGLRQGLKNRKSQFPNSQSLSSKMPTLSNTSESDGEIKDTQKSFLNSSPVENKPSDALDSNSNMNDMVFANNMNNSMIDGDDLDLAFKEASKFQVNHEESTNEFKTTTNYTYVSHSEIGHKIESLKPKIFLPHHSGNAFENIASYSAVLNSLDICRRRFVIIHFEQSPPLILIKALNVAFKSMNSTFQVSLNVQDFMSKKNNYLLVTNFRHVRGMEFENVIVVVNSEEYFLKHYLPEAIARCNSNLSLLMLEDKSVRKEEETAKGIVKLLQQQEPSVVETWITTKCEKCRKRSSYYCCKNIGHSTCLGINVLSDEFRRMEEHCNSTLSVSVDEVMTAINAEQV